MRKSLKRILTAALGALAFVAAGFGVSGLKTANVAKAETAPLIIQGKTLVVSNNVNLSFFVPVEAGDKDNIKVLAREVRAVDGVAEEPVVLSALSAIHEEDANGDGVKESFYEYKYKGVAAKEMPNVVYAYAYLESDPTVKSPEKKFSIVEYAHTMMGKGGDKLDTLIKATLDYGEAAAAFEDQTLPADYLNDYKLWELDESTNATFADGFGYSYVYEGQKVAIQPATNYIPAAGVDYLENNGDGTYTYTVPAELPNFENVFVDNSDNISDADKAQTVLDAITVDTTAVAIGDTLTLNTTPVDFEDEVTIIWAATGATLNGNVVTFDTVGNVTLTATVTCGEASASDIWTITVMPKVLATFEFGANGDAGHNDGSAAKTTYTETDGEYTLSLEAGVKMYPESYDAKGNSCIKFGTSSDAGSCKFTVPNEVVEVILYVAGYKANTAKVAINGAPAVVVNKLSDNGEYTQIIVDTSSDKTVNFSTATGGVRAMLNTIIFRSVALTAQEKVDTEVEALRSLELPAVEATGEVQLPMAKMYDDVTVTWSMDDSEFATLDGETGLLTVNKLPTEEDVILTLTVTVSVEGATSKTENTTIVLKKVVVPDPDPTPDPEEPGEGGDEPAEPTTVAVTIKDYAGSKGWANSTQYKSIDMNSDITVTATGGSNTGKYYTSGYDWRIYANESGKITVKAVEGKTIQSVKITFTLKDNGKLTYNGATVTTGSVVSVNASSAVFNAGNASGTKGKVFITAIEVIYQ